jgi:hypothetical protein
LSLLITVPCRSRPRCRTEPFVLAFAFARIATRSRGPDAPAPLWTPARARVDPGGKVGPWPPFLSRRTRRRV